MNFITGSALVHLQQHEENTFWFMVSLLVEHKFQQIFNFSEDGKFRVLCFQLEVCMQVYLPELHQHLKNNKIPTDIYASNWFITMFSNDLPFDMAPSVLDVFLLEGHKGLLRISLSLLLFLKQIIMSLNYDDLMVFLSHSHAREEAFQSLDQHTLFATASDFKITNNLLDSLERFFIVKENFESIYSDRSNK